MNCPEGPTSKAQIDSTEYESELIGENELGSVHIHGPFGDVESDVKIAYLIGMHPLESKSHRALFEKLTSKGDLKYCYYIYNKGEMKASFWLRNLSVMILLMRNMICFWTFTQTVVQGDLETIR